MAGAPPDLTIAPKVDHIGLLDFDCAEKLMAQGEAAVQDTLPFLPEAMTVF